MTTSKREDQATLYRAIDGGEVAGGSAEPGNWRCVAADTGSARPR